MNTNRDIKHSWESIIWDKIPGLWYSIQEIDFRTDIEMKVSDMTYWSIFYTRRGLMNKYVDK